MLKKRSLTGWLLSMLIFVASPILAKEEATEPTTLSLQDCIAIAQQHQVDILTGQNSIVSAKAVETQAKSYYYPQVALENTAFDVHSQNELGGTGGSFVVSQNIYDGGLREAKIQGAKSAVKEVSYGVDRTRQKVTYDVTKNYFSLLRAEKLTEVDAAQVKYLEGQLEMVRERIKLGDAAEVDALPIESSLANAHVDLIAAQNTVRTSSIALQQVMGLTPQDTFTVQDYNTEPAFTLQPIDQYYTTAMSSRPDVKQANASIASAKANTKSSKLQLYPRLVLSGQYGLPVYGDNDNSYTVTGGIAYDIFDGGYNRAAYRSAKANLSNSQLQSEQLAKDVQADIQSSYVNVDNAQQRLSASEISLKAARRNYEAQEERYKQGLAIPLDLLNAQVDVANAESNAVQARYDYYTAIAQLEYAIGQQGGLYAK